MLGVGKTDIGMVRTANEDSIFISNEKIGILKNLYIVSDGMGGHNGGEVASSKGIESFIEYINNNKCQNTEILDHMTEAIAFSNLSVFQMSIKSKELNGMGATFTGCTIENDKCFIVHVGDSRLYAINKENITQITTDHTYVNELVKAGQISEKEAESHHLKNIITRALGTDENCEIDGIVYEIRAGDTLLICSDGLTNKVEKEDIVKIVRNQKDISQIVDELVETAKIRGGDDNVSVILIDTKGVQA